jgi:hypothetical protein
MVEGERKLDCEATPKTRALDISQRIFVPMVTAIIDIRRTRSPCAIGFGQGAARHVVGGAACR